MLSMSSETNNQINNRIPPNIKLYLMKLIQHVPNIDIIFCGSITNFTYIENNSDVDCMIVYPDENAKMKVIQFITDDLLQFDIIKVKHKPMHFKHPTYSDEFQDVYSVKFHNGDRIDLLLVDHIGPIMKHQQNPGIILLCCKYILTWAFIYEIISKDTFNYLKRDILFAIRDYFLGFTTHRPESRVLKICNNPMHLHTSSQPTITPRT